MDYTATTNGDRDLDRRRRALSVLDASSTATGHLVNGTYALADAAAGSRRRRRLRAAARRQRPAGARVLERAGQQRAVAVGFKQPIGANEGLRTGRYAKTLTFTLSTTTP